MSRSFLEPLFWGDGVDELPVGGGVALPIPSGSGSPDPRGGGGPVGPQALNRGLASSDALGFDADSVPASATTGELGDAVGGLEGLHHGDDRGGLGLVPLPAAGLDGGGMTVDQQAHDDLGATLLSLE